MKEVKQESFYTHLAEGVQQGEIDWEVRLIDETKSVDDLRWKESNWRYELDTFHLNGLNERVVPFFFTQFCIQ